jgi:hypothetical protein
MFTRWLHDRADFNFAPYNSRPIRARLSPSRRSVGFIIATSAALPEPPGALMSVRSSPLCEAAPRVGLSRPDHARAFYHEEMGPGGCFPPIRPARTSPGVAPT